MKLIKRLGVAQVYWVLLGILLALPNYLPAATVFNDPDAALILTEEGQFSRYRIVLPVFPTATEEKAAGVLKDYLLQISGCALPVIRANQGQNEFEIILGQNERVDRSAISVDLNALKSDGFTIQTEGQRLFIVGGNEKGTLYGVYTFLEKYLGCRMFSPGFKIIPQKDRIEVPPIDDTQIPVIGFRDTHYRITWDDEYSDWHKLDHNAEGERTDWGMWVHTFNALVPPEIYYETHPEYFAEVEGARQPTQLCLSNPEVLEITIQSLRKMIARNPEATYWSVSQNDNRQYCTCTRCSALDKEEGSPSGSIIRFVNQVAVEFPDKIISTLAYEYGRKAPKNLKPAPNVNIMLCSIEVNRDQPISTDPTCADFREDVIAWGKISHDIIVWDYVIQFNNLISPFPNLHILQPNIQFFADHGVNALFEQGNREVGGEFAELRAYLLSKLMWDPGLNADSLINDFLNGYYGNAGPHIRQYIDLMRESLQKSGAPLRIFGGPVEASASYLTPELMIQYNHLFDLAEMAVSDQPEVLERVRIARLPLQFATMEQAKEKYMGPGAVFMEEDGRWKINPKIRGMIDPFTDLCNRQGVTRVKEWSTPPEEYRSAMYRVFSQGVNKHLALGKNVKFLSPEPGSLPPGAGKMLTDGKRGSHEYAYNWLSFPGADLEAVIDLGANKRIRHLEAAFYQYGQWLRLLPVKVTYSLSRDGKQFKPVGEIENTLPINQYGSIQRDFMLDIPASRARYVKIKATSIGTLPPWHPSAGRRPHMLIDEVVVE
ncbi:MAG: DUF4838 domain-containing protein [Saprospiraceae bacterium]|nr:DUF4838 domain-containing protein [Saprospiraceae bacterium]